MFQDRKIWQRLSHIHRTIHSFIGTAYFSVFTPTPYWVWYLLYCYSGGFSTNKSFTHMYIIYIQHFLTSSLQITRSKLESQTVSKWKVKILCSPSEASRDPCLEVRWTDLSLVSTAVEESPSSTQHQLVSTTATASVACKCTAAHNYSACDLISTSAAWQPLGLIPCGSHVGKTSHSSLHRSEEMLILCCFVSTVCQLRI